MIRMSEIVAMVLLGTWAAILAPESKGDGYRRIVRMITGLSLIFVIAETAFSVAENVRTLLPAMEQSLTAQWEQGEEIHRQAQEWITERGIRNVEQGAAALVRARFQTEAEIIAESSVDGTGVVTVESLRILVKQGSAEDLREMELYLENLLSCCCHAELTENAAEEGDKRM